MQGGSRGKDIPSPASSKVSELCSILSFGAGGSTKMVEPGTNHIERAFNLKYPKEYTERPEKALQNQAAFAKFYADYVKDA